MEKAVENSLEDSILYLDSVEIMDNEETKCFTYLWNIVKYCNIEKDVMYRSHYIYIRDKLHRLCYGRAEFCLRNYDRKYDNFYVNLFPAVKDDIKIKFITGNNTFYHYNTFENESMYCYDENQMYKHDLKLRVEVPNEDGVDVILPLNEFEKYLDLSRRMTNLYLNDKFMDLKIVIDDEEIEVHRAVLASSSPVFAEMLAESSTEKKSTIYIEDCKSEAVEIFLKHIYSGKMELLDEELALDVYKLADKYQLHRLKSVTSLILSRHLKIDNVIEYYKLAGVSQDSNLKTKSLKFIADHVLEIMRLPEWPTLRSSGLFVDSLLPLF